MGRLELICITLFLFIYTVYVAICFYATNIVLYLPNFPEKGF